MAELESFGKGEPYDPSLEIVDMRRMAFVVMVENSGEVNIVGQADPDYIVAALRALADDFEDNGWSCEECGS